MTHSATVCDVPTTTSTKTIRLSRSRLSAAVPVLERLGMDSRSAIELFLAQVVSRKAIPFVVALPDSEYAAAEYGLTAGDIAAAGKRMRRSSDAARRSGEVRAVSGVDSLRE
jgi:addiction module RelB/DinJ family antitoxin